MNVFTRNELKTLMEKTEGPCVSIFMPTLRGGVQSQQNPIRFKNMLREAEERIVASGLRPPEAKELLEPAQKLLQDGPFWRQSNGIALFLSPKTYRYYRLPFDFEELLVVSDRFNVKPLLRLPATAERFYILALSQNRVRLLEGVNRKINEIDLEIENIPKSLAEAMKYDDLEKQRQAHSGAPGTSIFHSHSPADDAKVNILRYFQQIDKGLKELLRDKHVPLLLAGVSYLLSMYREVNSYQHLLPEGIEGSPDRMEAEELYERAVAVLEPYSLKARQEAVDLFKQAAGTGLTSNDVKEIVPAAYYGRVDILFVNNELHLWGAFDPDTNVVELKPKAEHGNGDLLDLAAVHTILNGGVVYAVKHEDMPENVLLAAVYRY
jgi:hypothetical protein